jgi:hypothetical protein
LTYRTPRPIEDGTSRNIDLKVDYNGSAGEASTSYQVRGLGGAAINVPEEGGAAGENATGTGLRQISFNWWNGVVPLIALAALFGLSRLRFGVSPDELKAIVEAQGRAPMPSAPRQLQRAAPPPQQPSANSGRGAGAGVSNNARLIAVDRVDPVASEYSLMKDEVSIGRGEDNDVVIPHASVSRAHARLMRRDGGFELMDLNSTNGSFVDEHQVHGSAFVSAGSQLRLGDIRFVLRL